MESDARDLSCMSSEGHHLPPVAGIPELDGPVPPTAGDLLAIRAESCAPGGEVLSPRQDLDLLSAFHVPQANGPVRTAADEALAVAAKANAGDSGPMALQGRHYQAVAGIPHRDRLIGPTAGE